MMKSDKQNNTAVSQTATQFYNPITHDNDESFSYDIEIQKEYVQRLKVQREKIQILYSKYDVLLTEMKKKDVQLKEKDDSLAAINIRVKQLQMNCQQLSLLQQEHHEALNENMQLKHRVVSLENENGEMLEQMKLKEGLVYDEKNELDLVNEQLQDKLRSLSNKLLLCQQELRNALEAEKQKTEALKSQHYAEVTTLNNEVNMLKNELIKRDETIHMLRLENDFMQQKLQDQEDNYTVYLKDLESKIQKNQKEKKLQIQALRNSLQEKSVQITTLESKIITFKSQLQAKEVELEDAKKVLREEKKLFDDDIFQLKGQMNNEKLYFREQLMYCQNHIQKLEKKLNESLQREKYFGDRMKKHEVNQAAKRNLRQIERQQMEKINRILAFQ